jgi:hypothetical protein
MLTWMELIDEHPEIAAPGLNLLYPSYAGVGLAYLSTVRLDGGPRVHPMCPIVSDRGLFALIVPGPKCSDLLRDGRYAMHTFPTDGSEDAFYLTGRAVMVDNQDTHGLIVRQFLEERQSLDIDETEVARQVPFVFGIDMAMLTSTTGHGDPRPQHLIWRFDAGT